MSSDKKQPLRGEQLSRLYTKPLNYDERLARDAAYEQRKIANRPKYPALRLSLMLSGIVVLLLFAIRLANRVSPFDLHNAAPSPLPVLIMVSILLSAVLIAAYACYSTYRYAEAVFNYRDKQPAACIRIYLSLIFITLFTLFRFTPIKFETILALPIEQLLIVGGIHCIVAYFLIGLYIGYGRR